MSVPSSFSVIKLSDFRDSRKPVYSPSKALRVVKKKFTAIVYCEAKFATPDGKTANGLVRSSNKYQILSVIDSKKAGLNSGMVLDDKPNNIPICRDLTEALELAGTVPDCFILGIASSSGMLSLDERSLILEAISHGMNIVNGLHEFLSEDPVFIAACVKNNVEIFDVRRPRSS